MAVAKKKVEEKEVKDGISQESTGTPLETVEEAVDRKSEKTVVTAKAGKRSAKAIAEAEEKTAKETRKAEKTEEKPKLAAKPARSRLERAGKKLREAAKLVEKDKEYSLAEALDLAVKTSTTKFDSTVEVHIRLNVDPRQADQNIRGSIVLPSGSGRTIRVAVLAEGDDLAAAKKAGADIAGSEDFLQQLDKGKVDFDLLIATPQQMAKLGKYAKLLGPKGLMPNPKSGTVTTNVAKAVEEARAGRVEYRVDSTGIIHAGIGKVSFGAEKLLPNAQALLANVKSAKPASVKGTFARSVYLTTSMGPSVKVALSEIQ